MKREARERPKTLHELGREFVKDLTLEEKLVVSVFVAKLEAAAAAQQRIEQELRNKVEPMGVIDNERGWRLT